MGTLNIEGGGKPMELIDEGAHDAVLVAVVENGVHKRQYQGKDLKPTAFLRLVFEIPALKNDDGTSRVLGKEVTAIITEKSNLFKTLKGMGILKDATEDEVKQIKEQDFIEKKVLGTAVSLVVKHFEKKDGNKGHCIDTVAKLDPRLPQPEATITPYVFNFSEPDLEVFKTKLTGYGRERIMHSENVKDLPKEFHEFYISEKSEQDEKQTVDVDKKVGTVI